MGNKYKNDKKVVLGWLGMILTRKFLLIEFINFKMSDYFKTYFQKRISRYYRKCFTDCFGMWFV